MNGISETQAERDELYTLVRKVLWFSRRIRQTLDEPLEQALGLNTKELLVLAAIMDGFDTPSKVVERHSLPAPTVTRMVTKLVEAGLVRRVSDPQDLRRQRLELTEQGAATRTRTRAVSQDIVTAHFGHLDLQDVQQALDALTHLELALNQPRPQTAVEVMEATV